MDFTKNCKDYSAKGIAFEMFKFGYRTGGNRLVVTVNGGEQEFVDGAIWEALSTIEAQACILSKQARSAPAATVRKLDAARARKRPEFRKRQTPSLKIEHARFRMSLRQALVAVAGASWALAIVQVLAS